MRSLLLTIAVVIALIVPAAVHAGEPPTPEPPPIWDKSSVVVSGACMEGTPTFTILNHGEAMTGPINWYLLSVAGGASTCAEDVASGFGASGEVTLAAGASIDIQATPGTPPYRICVEQRPNHPGIGWASATITAEDAKLCATAEDATAEPSRLRRLFFPWLGR